MSDAHPGFEEFYRVTHGGLVTSIMLVTGDAETAREATDEAFARAVGAWDRVSAMDSPSGWTYKVALNVATCRHRPAKRGSSWPRSPHGSARPSSSASSPT